ncbi:MAG: hypothetical protein ROZ00_04115 [Denitratisoma sp.]|nr:hypothetical protein [Denitratisoma sp.]
MDWTMIMLGILMGLNALWFAAAFRYFSTQPDSAAKVLVPRHARDTPLFRTISASIRFLGGMNLALAGLALLILFNSSLFPDPRQNALFAFVFALAHGSQFYFNVPVARGGGRQGDALWPVLSGPMLFIFVVDGALMALNTVACLYFTAQFAWPGQ